MDIFLTVLKFTGIFLSGSMGILATLTKTHQEVSEDGVKRLNQWGKITLCLSAFGFLLAVISQVAEEIISSGQSQATAERANVQLAYIRGMMTRFDRITMESAFELPTKHPALKQLATELHRWSTEGITREAYLDSTNWPPGVKHTLLPNSTFPARFGGGSRPVSVDLTDRDSPLYRAAVPSLRTLSNLFNAFPATPFEIQINRKPLSQEEERQGTQRMLGDFAAMNEATNKGTSVLHYLPKSRQIFVEFSRFECRNDKQGIKRSNAKITGISDLSEARLRFGPTWPFQTNSTYTSMFLSLRPVWARMSVDDQVFAVTNFTRLPVHGNDGYLPYRCYEAVLPNETEIWATTLSIPPPWR